jgi:hypothetical protein
LSLNPSTTKYEIGEREREREREREGERERERETMTQEMTCRRIT